MKIIKFLSLIFSSIYIVWRFTTLTFDANTISLIFSIIFLLVEFLDYIEFLVFYYNTYTKSEKNQKTIVNNFNPEVDVIVATFNESEKIVEETIKACTEIDYNKKHIYIADDGKRENVKRLTEKYGVNYITRNDRKNNKAGNYNHALKIMKSPYILTLDCDMVPKKTIIKDLIPYFVEKDVGFVQSPQSFKNPDIFQVKLGVENLIPSDQTYFYNHLQKSKANTNTVVYCGTNAIIKREILEKVGGFCTKTITEDIATGMLIQNAGYRGIYIDKVEAVGVQENNIDGFVKQRSRWERGCLQVGRYYNPFKMEGLKLRQQFEYFTCISYWLFGIKRILFLIAPIMFSFFNIKLIECRIWVLILMWLPQYILRRFAIDKIYNNERSSTWNKIYEVILSPIFCIDAIKELIGIHKKKFEVSSKNNEIKKISKARIELIISHLILLFVNAVSLEASIKNITHNNLDIMSLIWSVTNIFYILIALIFDTSRRNKYKNYKKTNKYSAKALFKIFKIRKG